jgi:hypothetical protein
VAVSFIVWLDVRVASSNATVNNSSTGIHLRFAHVSPLALHDTSVLCKNEPISANVRLIGIDLFLGRVWMSECSQLMTLNLPCARPRVIAVRHRESVIGAKRDCGRRVRDIPLAGQLGVE